MNEIKKETNLLILGITSFILYSFTYALLIMIGQPIYTILLIEVLRVSLFSIYYSENSNSKDNIDDIIIPLLNNGCNITNKNVIKSIIGGLFFINIVLIVYVSVELIKNIKNKL